MARFRPLPIIDRSRDDLFMREALVLAEQAPGRARCRSEPWWCSTERSSAAVSIGPSVLTIPAPMPEMEAIRDAATRLANYRLPARRSM